MSVSQLARSIKASPTLKLNETAAKLREKGEPVIHLGGGEPKSKAPLDAVPLVTYSRGYYRMIDMAAPGAVISLIWVILMTGLLLLVGPLVGLL